MEVAADRSGGEPVTPARSSEEAGRVRLNVTLYAATVLLGCVAIFLGIVIQRSDLDLAFWKDDDASSTTPGVGQDTGRGVVTALDEADEADQQRVAAQLDAATKVVDAMVNLDYKTVDDDIEAVRGLATGTFLDQWDKASANVKSLAERAQSTTKGEVVWTGLVSGDKDSATVIVAATGTAASKTTEFKEEARNYRMQVELVLDKGAWLTSDLQYVP